MNYFAYRSTGLALKALTSFSRARVTIHNETELPTGGSIFAVNHFTRLETLLLPYYLSKLLDKPVWSLASSEFFGGLMGSYLEKVGALSVSNPDRDKLIIKGLVGESAAWIIFPEGQMVKNRKVVDRGNFMVFSESGKHPPHTGAVVLAWRAEILRQRLNALKVSKPEEFATLAGTFDLLSDVSITENIHIIPVNVSYYPLHFAETILSRMASLLEKKISARMFEELLVESSMLLSGADIDIRIGKPLPLLSPVKKFYGAQIPDFVDNKKSHRTLKKITYASMTAIYGLATVNLDHILAALLYKTSGHIFSEIDFRRRAFLVASSDFKALGIFCHRGLQGSQVDLLLERDGGRVADFIELVRAKGFLQVSPEPRTGFLELEKECSGDAFHRVRIENPFLVMANAIEPLAALQRLLRNLSWAPSWYLRRLTAKRLLQSMQQAYLKDRKTFQDASELCPFLSGNPYLVNHRSPIGIVLIHECLATPQSLKSLADYLGRQGFMVLVPRLPGHATVVTDLENRDYEQWQRAVDEAYAYVDCLCRKVVVCGVGSSIALGLSLASRGFAMRALIALFPAFDNLFKLPPEISPETLPETLKETLEQKKNGESKYCPTPTFRSDCSYRSCPAFAKRQVKKMLLGAAKNLPLVKTPLLMLQADTAGKADRLNAHKYFEKLASPEKELLLLPSAELDSLTSDENHGGRAVTNFILRCCN